jgi:hypothetical protein
MVARRIVLAGVVMAFATETAAAQATGTVPLQIGDRIRIKTAVSSSVMKGTLVAVDDAVLTLAPEGRDTTHQTFARSEIVRLEVARGKKRNVVWGVVGGAVAGLAVNMVWTTAEGGNSCDFGSCVILPAMGAAVGALAGVVIRTQRWETLPVEKVGLAVVPTRHGVQLSLSIRF